MARIIEFEGRHIEVPEDASDAEVASIISAAPAAPAAPQPGIVDRIKGVVGGDKVAPSGLTSLITGAPKPAAPAGDSWTDTIMSGGRVLDQGVRGAAEGMVNVATLPVEGAALAQSLNPLARIHPALKDISPLPYLSGLAKLEPILGAEAVKGYLNKANRGIASVFGTEAPQEEPQTFGQRVAHRVGEEVGAAAVPVGGAIVKGTRIGVDAARQLPLLERMFVEPAAIDAGKFATKEAGTAVAAGTGAAAINEATRAAGAEKGSWKQQLGDLLGALGGATTMGAARMIKQPTKDIFNALFRRDKFSNDQVKQEATDIIANASTLPKTAKEPIDTQPLVDTIMGNPKVSDAIPGYVESLGDRTRDPGIASMEYSRQTGPNAGDFVQRRTENTQAVDQALDASRPTGTPGALRSELESERTRQLNTAEIATAAARDNATTAVAGVSPQYTPQARGSTIRTAVDDALQRFVADTEAASGAAGRRAVEADARLGVNSDPAVRGNVVRSTLEDRRDAARQATDEAYGRTADGGREVNASELTDALDHVNAGLTETERGLVPQAMIERVRRLGIRDEPVANVEGGSVLPQEPATTTLKEATDLRSELLRRQRAALADPKAEQGGRNAARVIGQYLDAVEGFIRGNLSPEEIDALGIARATKTAEADSFTRAGDPVASVLQRYEGGNPRIRDERVTGQFVNPATDAPLTRLFAEADTPQVRAAIRDEIASHIPTAARNDPEALDRFMQDYEIPLRQFPGLRDEIGTAASTRRQATDAESAVGARRQEFHGDSRVLADVSARRADGTPAVLDEQIPGRFANPAGNRDLDALLTRADTPAVRSAIEDHILGDASGSVASADRIGKFVSDYAEPLKRFPGLRDRLEGAAAARTREAQASTDAAKLTRTLGTPDTPGTGAVGQYLRYGDEKSTQAMKGVLASKEPGKAADELLNFAGNKPEAVQGARRTFWDLMEEKSRSGGETTRGMDGRQPWMPNRLKGFLDDPANRAVAERLYRDNPEHLANIERISDALQGVDLRSRAKAPNTSGTAQGVNNVLTPETIQSRFYAYKRGQTSLGFMVTALASVAARRAVRGAQSTAVDKLLDEALLNPDVAAELLKENNPANRAALARTSKAFLGNETATVLDMLNGDDEDRTKAAAMKKGGK